VAEYIIASRHWDSGILPGDLSGQPGLLPNPRKYHWKGLRQLDARLNQQPDDTWL